MQEIHKEQPVARAAVVQLVSGYRAGSSNARRGAQRQGEDVLQVNITLFVSRRINISDAPSSLDFPNKILCPINKYKDFAGKIDGALANVFSIVINKYLQSFLPKQNI